MTFREFQIKNLFHLLKYNVAKEVLAVFYVLWEEVITDTQMIALYVRKAVLGYCSSLMKLQCAPTSVIARVVVKEHGVVEQLVRRCLFYDFKMGLFAEYVKHLGIMLSWNVRHCFKKFRLEICPFPEVQVARSFHICSYQGITSGA